MAKAGTSTRNSSSWTCSKRRSPTGRRRNRVGWNGRSRMPVTVELPGETEKRLRRETPDFDAEARRLFAVALFRDGKITHFELGQMLGLDRVAIEALLKQYRVTEQ